MRSRGEKGLDELDENYRKIICFDVVGNAKKQSMKIVKSLEE